MHAVVRSYSGLGAKELFDLLEQRKAEEVLGAELPEGGGALNPAFDVTPARLITAWITDRGVLKPPFTAEKLGRP